jgi:hypothetical protein
MLALSIILFVSPVTAYYQHALSYQDMQITNIHMLLFFLILFLQSKPECSAPAVDKVYATREPIATSNGKKRLDLPVQKNILTNYFCILSTYCYFDHENVTSIKFTY